MEITIKELKALIKDLPDDYNLRVDRVEGDSQGIVCSTVFPMPTEVEDDTRCFIINV